MSRVGFSGLEVKADDIPALGQTVLRGEEQCVPDSQRHP